MQMLQLSIGFKEVPVLRSDPSLWGAPIKLIRRGWCFLPLATRTKAYLTFQAPALKDLQS